MAGGGYPPPGGGQPPGFGAPPGYAPPPGQAPAPGYGPPGYGPPPGAAPMMMSAAAPYGVDPVTGLPFSDKQKVIAGLLQIFLGAFGAGRFYTGHTGLAIIQLVVCWVTCGVGCIWTTIDGVIILLGRVTDAQGRPLRD